MSVTLHNELYRVVHKTVRAQQVVEQHKVGVSKVGLNECPSERLREGPIKDSKRARGRPDRNELHAAGRLPPSSAHSMNARKCVHAQKPYPSQAVAHESSKGRKKDRGQEADGKKGSPTKQNTSEELKQGLPT